MEKQVKDIYNLNCNWYADSNNVIGSNKNSWTGLVIVYDDNSCLGYAVDAGHDNPTHVLNGTIVDEKGLSICKIHATNMHYDPIMFDVFENVNGKQETYYGGFFSVTAFSGMIPLGYASIEVKQKEKDQIIIDNISLIYDDVARRIKNHEDFPSLVLKNIEICDRYDVANQIKQVAETVKLNPLPKVFESSNQSQPNNE